jgi:hypothetical protein
MPIVEISYEIYIRLPPWEGERFLIDDGRRDYLAALMLGRARLFVCWLDQSADWSPKPVRDPIPPSGRLIKADALNAAASRTPNGTISGSRFPCGRCLVRSAGRCRREVQPPSAH